MGAPVRPLARGRVQREYLNAAAPSGRYSQTAFAEATRIRRYGLIHQKQKGKSDCFIVHVIRRGRAYTRRFAFSKHGGLAAALKAATAWRDECLAEQPVFTLREFHTRVRSNNTSGVPGVTFLRPINQPAGLWQAKISLADGRRLCRKFSVRKFGFDGAFARAVAARSDFIAAIPEKAYLMNPVAKRLSPSPGRGEKH